MNYGELKQNIRDLAFEEDEQMEEYETIVINAINRSLSTIEQEVAPIRKYIEIEQDGTDEVWTNLYVFNNLYTSIWFTSFTNISAVVRITKTIAFENGELETVFQIL